MEFLTDPWVSLSLILIAVGLAPIFDTYTSRRLEALEAERAQSSDYHMLTKKLIVERLKIGGVWLVFLVLMVIAVFSLP